MIHTPGRWTAFYKPKYDEWHVSVPLAGLRIPLFPDGLQGPREERDGNARLIAAAPDLLQELRRMIDHFEAWANDHAMDATAETWAALHCARAAIDKAEGR